MSVPFIIWTLRRTGGTSFTNLMMDLSGRPRLEHEPFNWNRSLGQVALDFDRGHNEAALRARLQGILGPGPSIKHAYEMVSHGFNNALMQEATDAGYRHIMLTREDEAARMLSLALAEQTGHWGDAGTRAAHEAIGAGRQAAQPFDIPAMIAAHREARYFTATVEDGFERLGADIIRVGFDQLFADPEAGRALILELCDILAIDVVNEEAFNRKVSHALTESGQDSDRIYPQVPNISAARRAIGVEVAGEPPFRARITMQQCQLPAADTFLIRVDAPFLPHREIYLDDAGGRPLLALMCQPGRPRPDGEAARLVISRHEEDGSWGPAITLDLPEGQLPGPFTLALRWGEFQLRGADGRTVLGFDPVRSLGPESVPPRMTALLTNIDLRRFSVQTGEELGLQRALARRIAEVAEPEDRAEGVTLIVLARAPELAARRREVGGLSGAFAETLVLNPWADPAGVDAAVNAVLAGVGTRKVMIASGRWPATGLAEAVEAARGRTNAFLALGRQPVWRAGMPFAVLGPARFAGRPVFAALAGMITADPAFLALADWLPRPGADDGTEALRRSLARLPFAVRRDGGTMLQLARQVRHPLLVRPGEHPTIDAVAAAMTGAGADDVILLAGTGTEEEIAALGRQPMAEVLATPAGLRLSPEVVAALDPAEPADPAGLADRLAALGFDVAHGEAAAPVPEVAPEVEPVWSLPDAVLNELMQRAAAPAATEAVAALRAHCASPAAFAQLVLQTVAAQVPRLADVVSNLELDAPGGRWIARMLTILRPTGLLADPEILRDLTANLIRRRYFDEVRALAGIATRAASPQTRLALLTADIAASVHVPGDMRFAGTEPARLLPPDLPPGSPMGHFAEALSHYLSVRRDWAGIVALVDLVGEAALTNFSYEHWIMARIGLGQIEGTEALIEGGHADWRLHDWSRLRLAMQLAHRAGDQGRVGAAVAAMLASDPEMAPLTARPTEFTVLNGAPGIAEGQIACVIVTRNEYPRLKWLIDYYRGLGVAQFVLIDNHSTDQTVAHFSGQPDIRILQTAENYRDSRFGVKWHNEVCERYFRNRWVLTVDADEVLVFDGSDRPGALTALTARMDAAGEEAFATAMIDMYAERPLDEVEYRPGDSLIEAFPLFDGTGYWFDRTASFPDTTVSGGVRIRRFWNDRHDPRLPYISMQKTPLVRWREGFRYLSSTHEMTPARMAAETGALLHFKFLPDFHARALEEVARKQHYDGAREYRIYAEILKDPANRSFRYPGSVRYEGPQTLIAAGLMTPRGRAAA